MSIFVESLVLAEERIDFQKDDFGANIERLIAQIRVDLENGTAKGNLNEYPVVKRLEDLIFRRLGLQVNLITNSHLAAIYPFYSNKNHIFLNELLRGNISLADQNKILKNFTDTHGTVNLSTAKVTGIFSEYKHPLYLNLKKFFEEGFSNDEITACLLHELGHGFSACYYADRTDRTNQVLANVHRTLLGTRTKDDVEYVYREISKISQSVKKEEVDKLLNGGRVVAGSTWFKMIVGVVRAQMLDDKYNDTSFEELSDSFAGRFGYSKSLALSLDKIHEDDFNKSKSALILNYVMDFVFIGAVAGLLMLGIAGGAGVAVFLSLFYSLAYFSASGEDSIDYTYDDLKNRHKRIRFNVIEQLKDPSLDTATVKTTLESIYAVDAAIKSTYQYRNIGTHINNLVFKSSRASFNSIDSQQLMEALNANDLFVKSAEFKTL